LHRIEPHVGMCGGDVGTLTFVKQNVARDPLALWHVPGTVSMLVAHVGQVDSRFILCTDAAPHMDGIHRAFGRMSAESVGLIQKWQSSLLTRKGMPSSFDLIVAESGLLTPSPSHSQQNGGTVQENTVQGSHIYP
jgi:cyclophilin family peptidyl-prolyl cis-trans isomerase